MDFQPNETQSRILELSRTFVRECVEPEARAWDRDAEIPEAFLERMARQGFLGMVIPPEFGGSGIDPVGYVLALMEIAAASPALGLVMSINNQVGDTILRVATQAQKERVLPDLVSGGCFGSIALTEPQAGSNVTAIQTSAKKVDGGYVLNGKKVYVSNGAYRGIALVCARTSDDRRRGLTFFLVDKDAEGARREPMERTLGLRATSMTVHHFTDCFVPEENRFGEEGAGFDVVQIVMGMGRLGVASQCVGIARAAFALALRHVKTREQFGGPLAKQQAVQFSVADMATSIDAAELMTLRAAFRKEEGGPYLAEAAMAKLLASEVAGKVTDAALQLHGGIGYFDAAPVARLYADARGTRIYEGTSEIMRVLIARDIIGKLG